MSNVENLKDIWAEKEIVEKFGLTEGKTGRSPQIGNWIAKGLPYILISGRRFFLEKDVVEFMCCFRKERKSEES